LLSQWQALEPDRIWFLSHTLLLIGAGMYVPTIMGLSNYLEKVSPMMTNLGVAFGVFGAMALFGQFAIDLAVGSIAINQTEMTIAFQRIQSAPAMNWIFYRLAPISFFIGQIVLVLLLTFAHQIPRWAGVVAVIGFVGLGLAVSTNNLSAFLLGFAGLALGSVRMGWQILGVTWRSGK
jgi:hypothetical protein